MLIPATDIFMYILGGALRPGYSHITESVSELLAPGSPNRLLLSIIDVIYALLHILFGISVLLFIQANEYDALIGRIGSWMIIAIGMAIVGTAIFPQDAEGTAATLPGKIHIILVFGVLIPFAFLSTLLIGIWSKRAGIFPGFALYSYISVGAIILTGGLGAAMAGTPIAGIVERLGALAVDQWLFVLALKLFLH